MGGYMRIVEGLFRYPVKGMRGVALESAIIGPRGIENDRAWMVVNEAGKFVTQREEPKLACITAWFENQALCMSAKNAGLITVDEVWWGSGLIMDVTIWGSAFRAITQGERVNEWLSDFCDRKLRLVRVPQNSPRVAKRSYAGTEVKVGFADGYPFLLTSEESLGDLNGRLKAPVPMNRFRPNIVVSGCESAFEEDTWNEFMINGITFQGAKPCSRCTVTTIDQETGIVTDGEPFETLKAYRNDGGKKLFGMYLNHYDVGVIRVGDTIDNIVFGPRPPA